MALFKLYFQTSFYRKYEIVSAPIWRYTNLTIDKITDGFNGKAKNP